MSAREPWWTCGSCGTPLYRVGRGKTDGLWEEHRRECDRLAGGRIVMWDQRELRDARRRRR